jgi:hypothetical protein
MALYKDCLTCGQKKQESEFYARYATCKECVKAKQRARNVVDKKKPLRKGKKTCRKCGKEKEATNFRPTRAQCLDCEREYGRGYNRSNRDKRNQWVKNNREKMDQLQADWYQKNKKKINEKHKEQYKYDPIFRLNKILRQKILGMVARIKGDSVINHDTIFLKNWLETNFELDDSIAWTNHGSYWNVDHVIPPKFFNIANKQERELCYSWVNLIPLSRKMNRTKSDQVYPHLVYHQICTLCNFALSHKLSYDLFQKTISIYISKAKSIFKTCETPYNDGNALRALTTHSSRETVKRNPVNGRLQW